jgi:hypothetical protein
MAPMCCYRPSSEWTTSKYAALAQGSRSLSAARVRKGSELTNLWHSTKKILHISSAIFPQSNYCRSAVDHRWWLLECPCVLALNEYAAGIFFPAQEREGQIVCAYCVDPSGCSTCPVISKVFVLGQRIQFSEGRKAGGSSEVSTCLAGKFGVGPGLSALPLRE